MFSQYLLELKPGMKRVLDFAQLRSQFRLIVSGHLMLNVIFDGGKLEFSSQINKSWKSPICAHIRECNVPGALYSAHSKFILPFTI